jgi:cytochrome c biogenesis protein CcmG/thiol:disulfide interchange protein DsbE
VTRARRTAALPPAVVLLVALLALLLSACGETGAGERVSVSPSGPSGPMPSLTAGAEGSGFLDPCPRSRPAAAPTSGGLPDLVLPCLGDGPAVTLTGLRGQPRLVTVWASWCAPCRVELPWLQSVADGGVPVLGVDAEDLPDSAVSLLDSLGVSFPSVYDPDNSVARALGIPSKPTTLFVAADGRVVFTKLGGFSSEAELRDLVREHLGVEPT